ncbi:MAG: hypothetical protein K2P81_01360 [Bacteriovoracaceae bacterium]|nr:hypothetical protein [Bacteriovoracaceae bacterium]
MKRISHLLRYAALALMTTLAVSCGGQPQVPEIAGLKGPFFNVLDGKVLISMTFEQLLIDGGARIPLPKMQNSYVELSPAQTGGTFFQVALDIADVDNTDWSLVDPHALPGGRPLPGVVGGQLPALAVQVPKLNNTTFYVSKQIFGFFVPFKVDTQGAIVTFRLYMQDGTYIGNISLVGNDQNAQNGGLLLLMNLNKSGKARLQKLIDFSKKSQNKGKLF